MLIASQPLTPFSTTASTSKLDSTQPTQPAQSATTTSPRPKPYHCPFPACSKSYTRPIRLTEHLRSHTNERPFICTHPGCHSTFRRESHLKAHERTHWDKDRKQFQCPDQACGKKFWTEQHRKSHWENVHQVLVTVDPALDDNSTADESDSMMMSKTTNKKKKKTYSCSLCKLVFRKHHLLRTHHLETHAPPGTLPFVCEEQGCGKSFRQKTHLKAHAKTHDLNRYLCLHPLCPTPNHSTWSSLQRHTKLVHPPTCPHPECHGKTFTTNRGLRNHEEMHRVGRRRRENGTGHGSRRGRKRKIAE
ncbi:hypothetical protein T439DRAFT_303315, partial [Meredithblackwellia eburnea MCA 4105]